VTMPTVPMRSCPSSCTTASPSCVSTGESSRVWSGSAPEKVAVNESGRGAPTGLQHRAPVAADWNPPAMPVTVPQCQIGTTSTTR
jgi:hypothetical protein